MNIPQQTFSVGIAGATGAVGEEILYTMARRKFPIKTLKLFASENSSGKKIHNDHYGALDLESFSIDEASKLDVIFLAVGGEFSIKVAEELSKRGVLVIDNSSAFRYKPDVPLIVPEINIHAAYENNDKKKKKKLIANPNCTTAIALMALAPIHRRYKIKKIIMSTYQAASGAGAKGMQELLDGTKDYVEGKPIKNEVFAYPLPFNLIPQIDVFNNENQYTKEELKVALETKKILEDDSLRISCTAVRIPTIRAHAEAITLETSLPINAADVQELLRTAEGVRLVDDPQRKQYPMPISATRQDAVEVGRIRNNDVFGEFGLDLFVCGDQVINCALPCSPLLTSFSSSYCEALHSTPLSSLRNFCSSIDGMYFKIIDRPKLIKLMC